MMNVMPNLKRPRIIKNIALMNAADLRQTKGQWRDTMSAELSSLDLLDIVRSVRHS
jgi:hypothetical protein